MVTDLVTVVHRFVTQARFSLSHLSCISGVILKGFESKVSFLVFSVCFLSGFSNGISGGVMVVWLCVMSRTCLLFSRSCRVLCTSPSLRHEGVLLTVF